MLLYGTYLVSLDPELRLLLPVELRTQFPPEECVFALPSVNAKLWLYPETLYEGLVQQMDRNDPLAEHMLFAMVSRLELDRQGRITLPRRLVEICRLAREVTVVGVRDHIELWNRNDWEARW